MKFSRSHRRHHAERLKRRRYKESQRYALSHDAEWLTWLTRKRLHTPCMCSCSTCGNPRRHYGNKAEARTLQERRPWE